MVNSLEEGCAYIAVSGTTRCWGGRSWRDRGFKGHLKRAGEGSEGEVLVEESQELNLYLNS